MSKRFAHTWPAPQEPIIYLVQIPPGEIAYVNSVIEAYEGLGIVRTRDQARGVIEIWIMRWGDDIFKRIVQELSKDIPFTFISTKEKRYDFET